MKVYQQTCDSSTATLCMPLSFQSFQTRMAVAEPHCTYHMHSSLAANFSNGYVFLTCLMPSPFPLLLLVTVFSDLPLVYYFTFSSTYPLPFQYHSYESLSKIISIQQSHLTLCPPTPCNNLCASTFISPSKESFINFKLVIKTNTICVDTV